jgi:hypothetical protein
VEVSVTGNRGRNRTSVRAALESDHSPPLACRQAQFTWIIGEVRLHILEESMPRHVTSFAVAAASSRVIVTTRGERTIADSTSSVNGTLALKRRK